MKSFIKIIGLLILIILFMFNFYAFLLGMVGNDKHWYREKTDCETRYNIDYIAPSRMLGCWLTKEQK